MIGAAVTQARLHWCSDLTTPIKPAVCYDYSPRKWSADIKALSPLSIANKLLCAYQERFMEITNELHNLSSEELVHLAMKASNDNKHDYAIQYLKQARQISQDPIALYLLAAEHAEIGMYQQAIEELNTVIEALPELWAARIQLALLQILTGQTQQPMGCIQPMLALPEGNHFRHFASGIDFLTKAEHKKCIEELEKGISLNKEIKPLNKDMQNLIEQLQKNTNTDDSSSEDQPKDNHLFINAYNTSL